MQTLNKDELMDELKKIEKAVKKSKNDAVFHASFIFSGVNPKFLEIKRGLGIREGGFSVAPDGFTKSSVLDRLKDMKKFIIKCNDNTVFVASLVIDELDGEFMKAAQAFNIEKAKEAQEELKKSVKRGQDKGNI